jgi:iron(III) transport system ATP-binding protein
MANLANQSVPIRLTGIVKRFDHHVKGRIAAVDNVNLVVEPGELLTLLGPSGCGKTTMLRMIAGFEAPTAGAVFIGDLDVTRLRANERNIGFVFQNYAIFPHLSVFENVAYGLRVQNRPEAHIRAAVKQVLDLVGLGGHDSQQPHQLSGGEQQRVALARAIVFEPRILMFDEPLSNLDAKLRVEMRSEIRELQKRLGITTVYVTHDQEEAMAISDRIAVMNRGSVVQIDTAEALYARPCNAFMANFIGQANLLPGEVLHADAREVKVRVLEQTLQCAPASFAVRAGDAVRVVVRPEQVSLAASTEGAHGAPGIVASRTFLGEKTEYRIAVGAITLHAIAYGAGPAARLAAGAAVTVCLPDAGSAIIRD